MISEDEARTRILDTVTPLDGQKVPVGGALDCFAAQDYFARLPLPTFDNSAMDGYAVVWSSCKKGGQLRVVGEQPAGPDRQLRVIDGEAVRIFTGAPLPQGADAILMQEDVTRHGTDISVNVDVEAGQFVRRRGCDLAEGQMILARGERIRAATVALLASQGFANRHRWQQSKCGSHFYRRRAGEIRRRTSTGTNLRQQFRAAQCTPAAVRCKRDNRGTLSRRSSIVRQRDQTRNEESRSHHQRWRFGRGTRLSEGCIAGAGAKIEIWRVAVKPGKPFLFGQAQQSAPSFQSSQRSAQSEPSPGREALVRVLLWALAALSSACPEIRYRRS